MKSVSSAEIEYVHYHFAPLQNGRMEMKKLRRMTTFHKTEMWSFFFESILSVSDFGKLCI